jgi:hypothetical protein
MASTSSLSRVLLAPISTGAYVEIMASKDVSADEATKHYKRISVMKARLFAQCPIPQSTMGLFGAVDVGDGAYWWDYGQLKLYTMNNLKLLSPDEDHEASTMRVFFNVPTGRIDRSKHCVLGDGVALGGGSCISHSRIKSGFVQGSILAGVRAEYVECGLGSILVNVTARKIKVAPGCVVYNVCSDDPDGIVLTDSGQVLTRVLLGKKDLAKTVKAPFEAAESGSNGVVIETMKSRMEIDGGKVWKDRVEGNPFSFEEVYFANSTADVSVMEELSKTLHDEASAALGV